jgi:hypothetical protein
MSGSSSSLSWRAWELWGEGEGYQSPKGEKERGRNHAHVVSDSKRRLTVHDEVDLDDVARSVVVDEDTVDRVDLVGEGHGLICNERDDQTREREDE